MDAARRAATTRSEQSDLPAMGEKGERARLENEVERLAAERDALRARLAEAEQELAELPLLRATRAELEAHRSSYSWRLTAPFRRLATMARTRLVPGARLAAKRGLLRLAGWLRDEE